MMNLSHLEVWFVTGSQHLYGAEALAKVAENSQRIAASLDAEGAIPTKLVFKPVLTTPDAIAQLCRDANPDFMRHQSADHQRTDTRALPGS